ncbi:MAG: DUF6157 family protein [Sulfuriferula sp.]
MHAILKMLQGGDRRSIGRSNEVVAWVLEKPELFDVLMSGMKLDDPLVAMRCADAAEKITVLHPEYLRPYKRALIDDYSRIEQKEVRWHIAAMLPRLPLTAKEQQRVIDILLTYTHDRSSIVKTLAMQALADLAWRDEKLKPLMRRHIEELMFIGTPAMKARGKKLLAVLGKHSRKNGLKMDNPVNQFIEIAQDCPFRAAVVPMGKNEMKTIACIEYTLLHEHPYHYTLAELKFATYLLHKQIPPAEVQVHGQQLRDAFFAKSYACMRGSPLTKQYGWGAHYDEQGRIALYAVESSEYRRFVKDSKIKKFFAMRSKRA